MVSVDFIILAAYMLVGSVFSVANNSIIQAIITVSVPILYYLDKITILLGGLYIEDDEEDDDSKE